MRSCLSRVAIGALAVVLMVMIAGCSSTGEGLPEIEVPEVSLPDVDVPDIEVPDIEVPDVDLPDVTDAGDNNPVADDGHDVGSIIGLIVLLVAGFAVVGLIHSSTVKHRQRRTEARQATDRQVGELLTTARWADDQAAQVMAVDDPSRYRGASASVQRYFADAESSSARLSQSVSDAAYGEALGTLGAELAGLRGALVAVMLADTGSAELDARRMQLSEHRATTDLASRKVSGMREALR